MKNNPKIGMLKIEPAFLDNWIPLSITDSIEIRLHTL